MPDIKELKLKKTHKPPALRVYTEPRADKASQISSERISSFFFDFSQNLFYRLLHSSWNCNDSLLCLPSIQDCELLGHLGGSDGN